MLGFVTLIDVIYDPLWIISKAVIIDDLAPVIDLAKFKEARRIFFFRLENL